MLRNIFYNKLSFLQPFYVSFSLSLFTFVTHYSVVRLLQPWERPQRFCSFSHQCGCITFLVRLTGPDPAGNFDVEKSVEKRKNISTLVEKASKFPSTSIFQYLSVEKTSKYQRRNFGGARWGGTHDLILSHN